MEHIIDFSDNPVADAHRWMDSRDALQRERDELNDYIDSGATDWIDEYERDAPSILAEIHLIRRDREDDKLGRINDLLDKYCDMWIEKQLYGKWK